jgi:hypothetical protein
MSINWQDVTDRIKAMARATTPKEEAEVAQHIGIKPEVLRAGLGGRSRLSAIKVIAALVRHGVDAKWMLTGEVNPSAHRRMLEANPDEVEAMVKALVSETSRASDRNGESAPRAE